MSDLTFQLLLLQRRKSFGLTLPFLIGATKTSQLAVTNGGCSDFGDLCDLLDVLATGIPSHYNVRIAKCLTLREPVAALHESKQDLVEDELVRTTTSRSTLYASEQYGSAGGMDALASALWKLLEVPITFARYSFSPVEKSYIPFSQSDLAFIESARYVAQQPHAAIGSR